MTKITRPFFAITVVLVLTADVAAQAQQQYPDCPSCPSLPCDPYCQYCNGIEPPDGGCSNWAYQHCSDMAACITPGCTSNWTQTSSSVRGTFGVGYAVYCEHHTLFWVTETDTNQCNTSSYYWTRSSCVDDLDGYKWGSFPDCCNGSPSSLFTCDHHHSC